MTHIRPTLGVLCSMAFLAVSPAWASVAEWELSSHNLTESTQTFSQLGSALAKWAVETSRVTDASHQVLFQAASERGVGTVPANGSTRSLRDQLHYNDDQSELASIFVQGGGQSQTRNKQSGESLVLIGSNTPTRPNTELDEAVARSAFNEEFVSVPTIQFASMTGSSMALSVVAAANVGVVPVPEISAFFPIIGLIVAVSCTQILRRRRAAQQSVFRRLV